MIELFGYSLVVGLVYFAWVFFVSHRLKRLDVADIGWGLGFIFVVGYWLILRGYFTFRSFVVFSLIVVWGLRLAIRIFRRNRNRTEDERYVDMKKNWKNWFAVRSFFQVFMLQGFLMILVSISAVYTVALDPASPLGLFDVVGFTVWLIGFYFESVADSQLDSFKSGGKKGEILDTGLWKYSRHPNYFGEVTLWWGIYLFSCSIPGGWQSIISPITISVLILFVSGVPLLEKKYRGNPKYQEYARKTSVFFPLPPKK